MVTAEPIVVPFTILVDSAEGNPYTFEGLSADAAQQHRPLIVNTQWACLGRSPCSLGDYTIDGFAHRVAIERKSMEDCWSTVLGWSGRRERFESELANLAGIDAAVVVVEASLELLLLAVPEWGVKTRQQNQKSVFRSIVAFQQDYRVPWMFCDSRELAEVFTFRFLERFWQKEQGRIKHGNKVFTATSPLAS